MKKSDKIHDIICEGELDLVDCGCVEGILNEAGRALDKACSHDICGTVLFRDKAGKFHVGTVEFVISPANPDYVVDELAGNYGECLKCRSIHPEASLLPYESVETTGVLGLCPKCSGYCFGITASRACQMVKGFPKKRKR